MKWKLSIDTKLRLNETVHLLRTVANWRTRGTKCRAGISQKLDRWEPPLAAVSPSFSLFIHPFSLSGFCVHLLDAHSARSLRSFSRRRVCLSDNSSFSFSRRQRVHDEFSSSEMFHRSHRRSTNMDVESFTRTGSRWPFVAATVLIFTMERSRTSVSGCARNGNSFLLCINYPLDWTQARARASWAEGRSTLYVKSKECHRAWFFLFSPFLPLFFSFSFFSSFLFYATFHVAWQLGQFNSRYYTYASINLISSAFRSIAERTREANRVHATPRRLSLVSRLPTLCRICLWIRKARCSPEASRCSYDTEVRNRIDLHDDELHNSGRRFIISLERVPIVGTLPRRYQDAHSVQSLKNSSKFYFIR